MEITVIAQVTLKQNEKKKCDNCSVSMERAYKHFQHLSSFKLYNFL